MPFGRIIVPAYDVRPLELELDRALPVAAGFHSRTDCLLRHEAIAAGNAAYAP